MRINCTIPLFYVFAHLCLTEVATGRRLGGRSSSSGSAVPTETQQFVVDFDDPTLTDDEVEEKAQAVARQTGGTVRFVYTNVMKGCLLTDVPMAMGGAGYGGDDNVDDDWPVLIPNEPITMDETSLRVQNQPPRGLDRIDQTGLPLDNKYEYSLDGSGVTIYIFDTGVRASHQEFSGRSPHCFFNAFTPGRITSETVFDCTDGTGHGTHVHATAGGSKFGVAKNATLVSVKVLDNEGNGNFGAMIAGLDLVVAEKKKYPNKPMVINMSLGGEHVDYVDKAVDAAVDAGVVVVVAAGNQMADACTRSPGSASKAITVGATGGVRFLFWEFESRVLFSNYGSCTDIFAPGSDILSASHMDDSGSTIMSGTSMASPHVAGAAALLLQKDPSMTPQQVRDTLLDHAAGGQLCWLFLGFYSPNLLLNVANL